MIIIITRERVMRTYGVSWNTVWVSLPNLGTTSRNASCQSTKNRWRKGCHSPFHLPLRSSPSPSPSSQRFHLLPWMLWRQYLFWIPQAPSSVFQVSLLNDYTHLNNQRLPQALKSSGFSWSLSQVLCCRLRPHLHPHLLMTAPLRRK